MCIYVGWPGWLHDAHELKNSALFHKVFRGELFPDRYISYGGVKVPLLLLSDPAYPILPWLMKLYTHRKDLVPEF